MSFTEKKVSCGNYISEKTDVSYAPIIRLAYLFKNEAVHSRKAALDIEDTYSVICKVLQNSIRIEC